MFEVAEEHWEMGNQLHSRGGGTFPGNVMLEMGFVEWIGVSQMETGRVILDRKGACTKNQASEIA